MLINHKYVNESRRVHHNTSRLFVTEFDIDYLAKMCLKDKITALLTGDQFKTEGKNVNIKQEPHNSPLCRRLQTPRQTYLLSHNVLGKWRLQSDA